MRGCDWMLVIGAALLAGGCAVSSPKATVKGVTLAEASGRGGRVEVKLALSNPNDVALPLSEMSYKVTAQGAKAFTYTGPPGVSLPAHGTQTLTLPAGLRWRERRQGPQGRSVKITGSVQYQPPGKLSSLLYDSGVPLPRFGFKAKGRLK